MKATESEDTLPSPELKSYFPVKTLSLRPWGNGRFSVYVRKGPRLVLYASRGAAFSKEQLARLRSTGTPTVYIHQGELRHYENYLRESLGELLLDESIPLAERAEVWHESAVSLAKCVLEEKLPHSVSRARFEQIGKLVRQTVGFLHDPGAVKNVARLVSKGYQEYQHGLAVMVLTSLMLMDRKGISEDLLVKVGVGALLHDVGKLGLAEGLLDRRPDTWTPEEEIQFRSHPALGVGLCVGLPLPPETLHCILFHHEQEDGRGFPAGLPAAGIPPYVKALGVCNIYDALTRACVWRPAYPPFEALRKMEARKETLDKGMFKRLIMILADAEILKENEQPAKETTPAPEPEAASKPSASNG
ncbi:metal dependent phosphohydrolase [Solidesulfovibrio fructosivorans JJ]]|uniref:Metal dependent phosphohydrolase n=1 Tax=Solidesulfovibrio fructosivorans JJ] TaxID=596151 RepID=E1K165_SOLFR|nr:HD domain-containing phosphohydrolase [Solidesulfovibrio fructosivorans]EFL49625.1 metal dependent phosphohydrolase [Solidesulfovibrio fructosivorans JJ]]